MGYSGAGGKQIHEKIRSKKSRGTVPLSSRQLSSYEANMVKDDIVLFNMRIFMYNSRQHLDR
jgi:hypothetical protein